VVQEHYPLQLVDPSFTHACKLLLSPQEEGWKTTVCNAPSQIGSGVEAASLASFTDGEPLPTNSFVKRVSFVESAGCPVSLGSKARWLDVLKYIKRAGLNASALQPLRGTRTVQNHRAAGGHLNIDAFVRLVRQLFRRP
jgi:hypothetical protein